MNEATKPWFSALRRTAEAQAHSSGDVHGVSVKPTQVIVLIDTAERYADLTTLACGFLTAYSAASVSDEEGLLQAVEPDEMRQLWHRVDEAAFDLRQFLEEPTAASGQEPSS